MDVATSVSYKGRMVTADRAKELAHMVREHLIRLDTEDAEIAEALDAYAGAGVPDSVRHIERYRNSALGRLDAAKVVYEHCGELLAAVRALTAQLAVEKGYRQCMQAGSEEHKKERDAARAEVKRLKRFEIPVINVDMASGKDWTVETLPGGGIAMPPQRWCTDSLPPKGDRYFTEAEIESLNATPENIRASLARHGHVFVLCLDDNEERQRLQREGIDTNRIKFFPFQKSTPCADHCEDSCES